MKVYINIFSENSFINILNFDNVAFYKNGLDKTSF